MATISMDYGKLNNLTRRLGLTWKIDDREGFDPHEPKVLLVTASGEQNLDPLDLGGTVDVLKALFELGILTDIEQQPAALQRLDALEKRMSELEEAILQSNPNAPIPVTEPPAEIKNVQKLAELRTRAEAIGINIVPYNDSHVSYHRNRFKIPGTRYKFYFTVGNALDQKRQQFRARYIFALSEMEELERWVAHDEMLYAECNRTYNVRED